MGSDYSPASLLQATLSFADSLPSDIGIIALGTPEYAVKHPRLTFHEVSEWITMEEPPLLALRRKKKSSIAEGLRLLKEKKVDAFLSAGSTGALVSASKIIVGTFPKYSRPALIGLVPTKKQPVAVLDIGAHLDAKEARLIRLAFLGTAYQKARGISQPRVGILNIGSEPTKGTPAIKAAYKKLMTLKTPPFLFVGNVEGNAAFQGDLDVLITDGFTGNIFLKTAEGTASLILDELSQEPTLMQHSKKRKYPAALLAGVKETVIKCHSYSSPEVFVNGIRTAIEYSVSQFTEKLRNFIM